MARLRRADSDSKEPSTRPNAKIFAEIAARSKSFRPAREVLRKVRAVPTIFPAIDWKTRVGGWPIDRPATVHGPSGMGKTSLCYGLGLSFLQREHMFAPIDAERTTPHPWLQSLFGAYADDPRFIASRPDNYEQATYDVRLIATGLMEAKDRGDVPPETSCLFLVDSLDKLVPIDIQEKIRKHAAESKDGSVDGYNGASGMIQAALNKAWLNQLVPLMDATGCAIILILREAEDRNATARDRMFGNDWRTTGGRHLRFESSLDVRVSHATMIHEVDGDWKSPVVGERHIVEIHKTKVSAREDVIEKTYFSTSNGAWTPVGFDRARDLLDLGTDLDVIERKGPWLSFDGRRFQGEKKFLQGADPAYLDALEKACRSRFGEVQKVADVLGEESKLE